MAPRGTPAKATGARGKGVINGRDRGAICDSIPWFARTMGGVHYKNGLCWGFLVDEDSGIRSYIDDELIITRTGGGNEKSSEGGEKILTQTKDHDEASPSMALQSTANIIPGNKNQVLRRKLPHRYNVMAFFRIADMWYEKINNKKACRVRLEKLDLSEKSWWAEKGSPKPVPHSQRLTKPDIKQCPTCLTHHPKVYSEGWMCLSDKCAGFWKLNGAQPPVELTFDQKFLDARLPADPEIQSPSSLVPNLLSTMSDDDPHISTSTIARKGVVCPMCKKCITRRFWNGWKCTDPLANGREGACTFQKVMPMHLVSVRSVSDDFELGPIKRAVWFDSIIKPEVDNTGLLPYRRITYKLGDAGYVTHLMATKDINARDNGPNDLFQQLQVHDLGLRRYPLSAAKVSGTLNAQFAVNFGMPYKYVVAVDSLGFNQAPDPVLHTLGRLTWATERAVSIQGGAAKPPNELLLLGYFEGQNIGYHDDGESTLGPTIATLSLGASSIMSLRMKTKYYLGLSKSNKLTADDPILPQCNNRENRLELKAMLEKGSITAKEYEQAWLASHKKSKPKRDCPDLIKMVLHHGDMVIMHGEGLQKFYEHEVKVDKDKALRFAVTARHVLEEKLTEEERGKGVFNLTPAQTYGGQ
ncbi:hypothetical protein BDW59DRAFT_181323 [Aspergillus cavernicola]|uniref:Fe2OG dioxygenase domain-containing protein n=1 Tax=Aspergillus cavernicola TaxID=176166 RepID=A0ABR4I049_9EURO